MRLCNAATQPVGIANGTYSHDCCGEIVIADDELTFENGKPIGFLFGEDAKGAFILPSTYVGTWEDRGFEIDGTRAPLKLRLDAGTSPATIELPAAHGSRLFTRKKPARN